MSRLPDSDSARHVTTTRLRRGAQEPATDTVRYTCLTVMAGPNVGHAVRLNPGRHIVGRAPTADVVILDDDVSRAHAQLDVSESGQVQVTDLSSTNGVWLDGEAVPTCTLQPGDKFVLGSRVLLRVDLVDDLDMALQALLRRGSTTDPLTGCLNRRWLDEALPRELSLAARTDAHLAVAAVDIDHFKDVNDARGHTEGDEVLCAVVEAFRAQMRGGDGLVRLGGDEFALLMRGATLTEAAALVQAAATLVRAHDVAGTPVTISAGIAEVRADRCEGPRALLRLADERLYAAKRAGRDQIVCDGEATAVAGEATPPATRRRLEPVRRGGDPGATQQAKPPVDERGAGR